MWYWYLVMFLFGMSLGGFLTLIGLVFLPAANDEE